MASTSFLEAGVLLEVARALSPLQREILLSLYDRGPGALLEVAVRVLKFPDEVRQPLSFLRESGLVAWSNQVGAGLGGEVISLTPEGARLANLMRDETFLKQLQAAPSWLAANAADPRQQQVDLLQKLGDLAANNGDPEGAKEYYTQALEVTRRLDVS